MNRQENGNPKDFPEPIVSIIDALSSDQRRRILIEVKEAGQLSYSEVLQRTGDYKGTLNYHLKKLVSAGLLRNFLIDREIRPYTSFYEVTQIADNVVDGIINAFTSKDRRSDLLMSYPISATTSGFLQVVEVDGTYSNDSSNQTSQFRGRPDLTAPLMINNIKRNK